MTTADRSNEGKVMTDVENYRIEDKTRVNLRGKPATSFKMFERNGRAFVFAGNFFRPGGYEATDAQCIAFARFEGGAEDFDPLDPQD